MRRLAVMMLALAATTGAAMADPIEGTWRMPSGNDARIASCGDGFCLTYVNGPNKGKTFGKMTPSGGGAYQGTVTDYTKGGKEYSGKGKLTGDTLSVSAACSAGSSAARSR